MGVERLDDPDYPAMAMGQAAHLLDVEPAFLRSLDNAGAVNPHRSTGGHRRYSRRQLEQAVRLRELLDDGHSLESAATIDQLRADLSASESRLTAANAEVERLRNELDNLTRPPSNEDEPTARETAEADPTATAVSSEDATQ
ncbi:helix-turn-helix domain-containing protein [Pseudonocardia parietis]|uniref:DNA-binding transcriptional MerR regulator n=1 Tax=Pseudonocardia parietis TaxID=570936 RepID=A0ABS4W6X0_9PSEU|nr:helix-turn-helix domain-containing protein [Pseudonocardia parietis]MBP2371957.1 DNA-binding transcriptional MerR regulator [Pseudonocardia parietis]